MHGIASPARGARFFYAHRTASATASPLARLAPSRLSARLRVLALCVPQPGRVAGSPPCAEGARGVSGSFSLHLGGCLGGALRRSRHRRAAALLRPRLRLRAHRANKEPRQPRVAPGSRPALRPRCARSPVGFFRATPPPAGGSGRCRSRSACPGFPRRRS